jgi:hypothetical protein
LSKQKQKKTVQRFLNNIEKLNVYQYFKYYIGRYKKKISKDINSSIIITN